MLGWVQYSHAERRLFKKLGIEEVALSKMQPSLAYISVAADVFCKGAEGPHVEAFRLAAKAMLITASPKRLTEEFDSLCDYDGMEEDTESV